MKRAFSLVLFIGAALSVTLTASAGLLSFARTEITSFTDPAFRERRLTNVMVLASLADIALRTEAERAFVEQLNKSGISALPSIDVIPPTRNYTAEEINRVVTDNGICDVMVIVLTDTAEKKTFIPPSFHTYGNSTYMYGGYTVSKPRLTFQITLYDAATGNAMWIASALTSGTAHADFKTIIKSLSRETAEKLKTDGFIQK